MPTTGWSTCATRCGSARPWRAGRGNHATFVEVSPHPLLTYAIGDTLASMSSTDRFIVTSAMKRGDDETLFCPCATRHARCDGPKTPTAAGSRIFPPSPWLHSSYWVEKRSLGQRLPDVHPLLGVHVEMPSGRDHVWQADIGTETMPWLADHKVHGQAVMSAAGFAEMALAAGCEALGLPVEAVQVNDARGRADACPGSPDASHDTACSKRRRDSRRDSCQFGRRQLVVGMRWPASTWRTGMVRQRLSRREGDGGRRPKLCCPTRPPTIRVIAFIRCCSMRRCRVSPPPCQPIAGDPTETPYLPVSLATIRVFGQVGRRARCRTELVEPRAGGCRPSRPDRPHRRHGDSDRGTHRRRAAAGRPRQRCRYRWSRRSSTPNGWKVRRHLKSAERYRLRPPGAGCCWPTTTPRQRHSRRNSLPGSAHRLGE